MTFLDQIERHEGRKRFPYVDTAGKITIGVGRNLTDDGLSEDEIDYLLMNDVNKAVNDLKTFAWWEALDDVRRNVLLDMRFNLGPSKFRGFRLMLAAVAGGDYERAGDEMQSSDWFTQVKSRGKRLLKMMRTGVALFVFCVLLGGTPLWAQTWPPRVQDIADALAGLHPTWVSDDTGPRLALNTMIAQQVCFELGSQWGMKRADPTRPISSDIVAFTGPPFVGYDWETAHNGTVGRFPPPIDLNGQTFVPVACMNHLNAGSPQPVPQPIPQPQPPPSQPPVVIVQPPALDLSGIARQLDEINANLTKHADLSEAHWAEAKGIWEKYLAPFFEFTLKYVVPPVTAWILGKQAAQ